METAQPNHPMSGPETMDSQPQPLRILMVAPQPFFRPRGTPFSVAHRIRALLDAGHSVDLVAYPFGEDLDLPGLKIFRSRRPPLIRDVKIGPSVAKLFLDVFLYFSVRSKLRSKKYDVIHTHEEAAFFAMHLARRYGLLHVYDMHSSLPHQLKSFQAYDFGPFRATFSYLERRVLETSDGVITICKELDEISEEHRGSTPHSMIENTGDDSTIFGREISDLRSEYGLGDKKVILYTGTFEPYQGLDLLLAAYKHWLAFGKPGHLFMVGGNPKQIEHYEEMAKSMDLGEHVTFTGSVHPSKIPSFVAASDLIVSPRSKGEYTPLKIYNYMRSKKPILATDLPTHTQTLNPTVSCLAKPEAEAFAEGMRRVLDDPDYAKDIASAAYRWTEEHYSDGEYLSKVATFYQDVVQSAHNDDNDANQTNSQGAAASS